jgi:hypothetical protein
VCHVRRRIHVCHMRMIQRMAKVDPPWSRRALKSEWDSQLDGTVGAAPEPVEMRGERKRERGK